MKIFRIISCFMILISGIHLSLPAMAGNKVLFYMHGSDMHGKSEDHKNASNYRNVVDRLTNEGFEVIFEFRTEHNAEAQAAKTAQMVNDKIASGTAPEDIIVSGFSYGSMISLLTSGLVGNDKVNYALFCGCPESPSISVEIDYSKVKGNVLSIIDEDDSKFGSCDGRLPAASSFKETVISSGKGHKVFKLGKDKFLDLWVPTLTEWANQ